MLLSSTRMNELAQLLGSCSMVKKFFCSWNIDRQASFIHECCEALSSVLDNHVHYLGWYLAFAGNWGEVFHALSARLHQDE